MTPRDFFNRISYLQYPIMLAALGYCVKPMFGGLDQLRGNLPAVVGDFNTALMFMGVGIGVSTLQDTTKVQNEFSRKVWTHPGRTRWALGIITAQVLFFLGLGIAGYILANDSPLTQLSIGLFVLGLGMLSFLKAAIEMAQHHGAKAAAGGER